MTFTNAQLKYLANQFMCETRPIVYGKNSKHELCIVKTLLLSTLVRY